MATLSEKQQRLAALLKAQNDLLIQILQINNSIQQITNEVKTLEAEINAEIAKEKSDQTEGEKQKRKRK